MPLQSEALSCEERNLAAPLMGVELVEEVAVAEVMGVGLLPPSNLRDTRDPTEKARTRAGWS